MTIKQKINKDAYAKLTDELKTLYIEKDDSYVLDIDNEDISELKRAKDREATAAKEYKQQAKELQAQLDELTGNDAKRRGDIATLEKAWQEKTDKLVDELNTKIKNKDAFIQKTLVDAQATQLATKLCGDKATLILPHIKQRLIADLDGDEPVTKVVDQAGRVSAFNLADLEKEFIANKDFSSIIVGSKASGGAAKSNVGANNGANRTVQVDGSDKPLSDLAPHDLAAHLKAQREAAQQ